MCIADSKYYYRTKSFGHEIFAIIIYDIIIIIICTHIIDIDECLEAAQSNTDLCQDKNSECVNNEGSYMCTCVPGYENINNTCSRKFCVFACSMW